MNGWKGYKMTDPISVESSPYEMHVEEDDKAQALHFSIPLEQFRDNKGVPFKEIEERMISQLSQRLFNETGRRLKAEEQLDWLRFSFKELEKSRDYWRRLADGRSQVVQATHEEYMERIEELQQEVENWRAVSHDQDSQIEALQCALEHECAGLLHEKYREEILKLDKRLAVKNDQIEKLTEWMPAAVQARSERDTARRAARELAKENSKLRKQRVYSGVLVGGLLGVLIPLVALYLQGALNV